MRKKVLSIILAVFIMSSGVIPVYAASSEPQNMEASSGIITPYMDYIADASLFIDINSNQGVITIDCFVYGYQDLATRTSALVYLQQYRNGQWVTIRSFYSAEDKNYVSVYETVSIEKGYKYRAKATIRAYNDLNVETREMVTPEATY